LNHAARTPLRTWTKSAVLLCFWTTERIEP
jgi:hypothetical protein